MLMNSVHEQCPNSDPKTVHYHKTGLCAQCAHLETRSRAHYAYSAQVVGAATCTTDWSRACQAHSQRRSRAQLAQVARSTCAGRALSVRRSRAQRAQVARSVCPGRVHIAQVLGTSRDLPSAQPKLPRSRPQKNGVATPISIGQPEPCRDIKSVSRHHLG